MQALLGLGGYQAGFKQAFGDHQSGNQTQHKNGLSGMIFSVTGRHCITCRFDDAPAYGSDHTGDQNPGGSVIF